MTNMNPRVFVGSSTEGLQVAQAVRSLLARDAQVTMWNEGFFSRGSGYLETLIRSLEVFDFAVIIASTDDTVVSRGKSQLSVRDNVLFELGLFMGHLGRDRTFLLRPGDETFQLPSDLLGVSTTTYELPEGSELERLPLKEVMSILGPACDEIRDALYRWRLQVETNVLTDPGVLRCYTNATEAQAAIGRSIANARRDMLLMATNFSYTPVLNVAEFQEKAAVGVQVRFLVINPFSSHLPSMADEFLISLEQLQDENRLHLATLRDLQVFSRSAAAEGPGSVEVRLYDTIPHMRSYIFDGAEGESFFVPYAHRTTSRPLPVFHCANSRTVARRYWQGVENLWRSPTTVSLDAFVVNHPDFLPAL